MTFDEAGELRTAVEQFYEKRIKDDPMLHRMVDMATAEALTQVSPYLKSRIANREQWEIARIAAIQMMSVIYANDCMLTNLTAERDHFRKLAEDALMLRPPAPFVIKTGDSIAEDAAE